MDAGNILKPMLGRGELRCIGATTLDEFRQYVEKDPALERRFQQVFVDQPSVPQTVSILRGLRERYPFVVLSLHEQLKERGVIYPMLLIKEKMCICLVLVVLFKF